VGFQGDVEPPSDGSRTPQKNVWRLAHFEARVFTEEDVRLLDRGFERFLKTGRMGEHNMAAAQQSPERLIAIERPVDKLEQTHR